MSRRKKLPSLPKILLDAIAELREVFGIEDSLIPEKRDFVKSIRRHHKVLVTLKLGQGRTLVWTKEGGKRTLILSSLEGGLEDRYRFGEWTKKPAALNLCKRGIRLGYAPYVGANEVEQGADDDVIMIDHKKQ